MIINMYKWVKFPEDLESSVSLILSGIEFYYQYYDEEKIFPSKNEKLKESFEELVQLILFASIIYNSIQKDAKTVETFIDEFNQKDKKQNKISVNILNLINDILYDLNMTYLNTCLLMSNPAFRYKPLNDLNNVKDEDDLIKELDKAIGEIRPLVENMVKQRENLNKYVIEFGYLSAKLDAQ